MEKTIWKYELNNNAIQVIEMPEGAEILCVQNQLNKPCIWVLVNPEARKEERGIEVFGTGWKIDTDVHRRYIGTFQDLSGNLVWHAFERLR